MQEQRHDGTEKLTEDKPGAVFQSKGRTLQVTHEGKLKELRKRKRQAQRKARKRSRR